MSSRRLPQPDLPGKETTEVRLIELKNKLKVLLISSSLDAPSADPKWAVKFPQTQLKEKFLSDRKGKYFPTFRPTQKPSSDKYSSTQKNPQCAISFCVKSGSFKNPREYQGLAHFVEHLVHHGSKKYPGEFDHEIFTKGQDGYSNASTDANFTSYYCVVNSSENNIRRGCEIYSSLLSDPLIPLNSVVREIESVDNEHFMNKIYDSVRLRYFIEETCIPENSNSPLHKFFDWGSKESLMPKKQDSAQKLRDEMLKFVRSHYFAANMSAVIMAPFDLDNLEQIAVDTLSHIPEKSDFPKVVKCVEKSPFDPKMFNRIYTLKTLSEDGHTLVLTWILEADIWQNYQYKTSSYLAYIFEQRGPGSLQHFLTNKKWIYSLYCPTGLGGSTSTGNEICTYFRVYFYLTFEGNEKIYEVLSAMFSFINLHQKAGAQEAIFRQMIQVERLITDNFLMSKNIDSIEIYSTQLLFYEPKDVILGQKSLHSDYRPDLIEKCLKKMTPECTNFIRLTYLQGPEETFVTSKLLGTQYKIENITTELLSFFSNVEPYAEYELRPSFNPYLMKQSLLTGIEAKLMPEIMSFGDNVKISFMPKQMKSPQIFIAVTFWTSITSKLSRAEYAYSVWSTLVTLDCKNKLWAQSELGLDWNVGISKTAFSIVVTGLRSGFFDAVEILIKSFLNFDFDERDFQAALDYVLESHYTNLVEHTNVGYYVLYKLSSPEYVNDVEHYEKLKNLTYVKFLEIITEFKRSFSTYVVIEGATSRDEVIFMGQLLQSIKTGPKVAIADNAMIEKDQRTIVPRGEHCIRIKSIVPESMMFVVSNFYELAPYNPESDYITNFIRILIDRVIYTELRYKEQLGYSVSVFTYTDAIRTGLLISVTAHSEKHSPCFINYRIDSFLSDFYNTYFTEEAIKEKLNKDQKTLLQASYLRGFYSKYLLRSDPESELRKITIQVLGDVGDKDKGYSCLCDIKNYENEVICKKSRWLNPVAIIGKYKKVVAFGGDLETENGGNDKKEDSKYFIISLADYHHNSNA